jgi:hypothetical protein
MKMRALEEEGLCWQNSRTTLRIWGMKAVWPLTGAERSCALSNGLGNMEDDDELHGFSIGTVALVSGIEE